MHREDKIKTRRTKLFDVIFMVVLILAYSFLSFFNLGDDVAPQSFYKLTPYKRVAIILPEETEVSKIVYYVGQSRNDFNMVYQTAVDSSGVELSKEHEFAVDGPFRWRKTEIKRKIRMIILRTEDRDVDFGEISVFSGEKRIENIELKDFLSSEGVFSENELLANLTDEQDLIPEQFNYHNSSYFDELYFAQTAYQYAVSEEGYETVHPPIGKILQSIPIKVFGRMTPFTWRFAGNIAGILIIIVVYFLAKELFGRASYGRLAAILTALSGLHFVQTRVGTIDSHLCLFTLLMFFFMLKFLKSSKFRYFLLSGIFFGCSISVKWSGAFGGIGLAIMFFWWVYQKYFVGINRKNWREKVFKLSLLKWFPLGVLCFIIIPAGIYFGSYLLFPETTNAHSISDVVSQGQYLFSYHSSERTPHPYSSPWFSWPLSLKPMLYEYVSGSERVICLYGNYAISFVSVIALLIALYFAVLKRSRTAMFIIVSFLSLWLPYAFIQRPMFLYHYLPASGFAILAITEMFFEIPKIRKIVPFLLIIIILVFIVSYPRFSGV